jgi:enterochelin esterase-like enzyme
VRRRRALVGVLAAAIASVAFAAGAAVVVASKPARAASPSPPSPAQTASISCRSPSLGGTLPAIVYLPAGYRSGSGRYRVIYFLHGLPASPSSYTENAFVAQALAGSGRRAIVVAPQGARNDNSDREYLDWGPNENWPQAIAHDLTHCIDARYHTIANRSGRALVGLSAGGYGAFNIGLRNLSTFAAVESWSGYFAATDPTGDQLLDLGSDVANASAQVPDGAGLKAELAKSPSFLAFYVGNQDSRFLTMNKVFDQDLTQSHVQHLFRIYPGGHSSALWRAQAPSWLGYALGYLSRSAKS